MDFFIAMATGGVIAFIGFMLGIYAQRNVQRPKNITRKKTKVSLSQKSTQKESSKVKRPAIELGGVNRPTAEDLEKMQNPKIEEIEKEWDRGFKEMNKNVVA